MKPLILRLRAALDKDPEIATIQEQVLNHPGNTLEYLQGLGLEKRDLKRLEKIGMAVRGRDPTAGGHRIKWILVLHDPNSLKPFVTNVSR